MNEVVIFYSPADFHRWLYEKIVAIQFDIAEIKKAIADSNAAQAKIDALAEQIRQNNERLRAVQEGTFTVGK